MLGSGRLARPPFSGSFRYVRNGPRLSGCLYRAGADRKPMDMKPRISVVTLGVADLEQSLVFYRDGIGLPTEGTIGREFEHGAVAFFDLSGGFKLATWAEDYLSYDTALSRKRDVRGEGGSGS